jgi:hypothetical protein
MSRATSSAPHASPVKIPHEKIAQRAYEKWLQRGRTHGDGVQDWLDAEQELREEIAKGPSAAAPTTHRR